MQGYPSYLNNRSDYEYVRNAFPSEQWRASWQELLDTRFIWKTTADLGAEGEEVADATHRVAMVVDPSQAGRPPKRVQQERVENEKARLFLLGFTVTEVEAALEE